MLLKTILNRLLHFKGFVYGTPKFVEDRGTTTIEIPIRPRANSRPSCGICQQPGAKYGTLPQRYYEFVPLWGLKTYFNYTPRRVQCHGCHTVSVECLPWASGKEHQSTILQQFLAHWAKKLSWQQVAEEFKVSWNSVYRAVTYVVAWGLLHRDLSGVTAIGVDELMTWKGYRCVTLVYQIDAHCKRLLWLCKDRSAKSFSRCFDSLGPKVCAGIQYVCSDMWRGYLRVIRERLPQATHVLDRFHIVANLNKALDQVRADEAKRLKLAGDDQTLKHTRWCLLKRPGNLTRKQRGRLKTLLGLNLKTVRAYLLAKDFGHFWKYNHPSWAARFLDAWCRMVQRSRIEPIKKIARQLRSHKELILNWFRTKKMLSSGVVEALNNNAKLTIRKAYGFRDFKTLEIALFHTIGALPDPPFANKFW